MTKVKSNAAWNDLSAAQRNTLEEWLFIHRLGLQKALIKAKTELGFTGSLSSLHRFYQRTAQDRLLRELTASATSVKQINEVKVEAKEMKTAAFKVMAQTLLQQVTENPQGVKLWGPIAQLLLRQEELAHRQQVRVEDMVTRRKKYEIGRQKWHYDIVREAVPYMEELVEWQKSVRDPKVAEYEANREINAIRKGMFGPDIPEILPENEEEAKAMIAAEQQTRSEFYHKYPSIYKDQTPVERLTAEEPKKPEPPTGTV